MEERVIWRGKKEEGMTRFQKEKLIQRIKFLLTLNDLAVKRMGQEIFDDFDLERAAKIKRLYRKDIRRQVKICRRLPFEILDKIEDFELFCFGYFGQKTRQMMVDYYCENVEEY